LTLDGEQISRFSTPVVADMDEFSPTQMEIRRPNNLRGDIPGRLYLLGQDNVSFEVYAIPREWNEAWTGTQDGISKGDVVMEGE
jgi:hypothetical protein